MYLGSAVSARTRQDDDPDDSPVKFTTSKAAAWRASQSYGDPTPPSERAPPSQPFVVLGSLFAVLVYFCILREENDTDMHLSKPLFDRIHGLEEEQIRNALKSNSAPSNKAELLSRLQELIAKRESQGQMANKLTVAPAPDNTQEK